MFQFHTGSIKSCNRVHNGYRYRRLPSFNSILVRLKGCYATMTYVARLGKKTAFQFHTGSIKSR